MDRKEFLKVHAILAGIAIGAPLIFFKWSKHKGGVPSHYLSKFFTKLFYSSKPYPLVYQNLIGLTNIKEGEVILDVGCGEFPPLDLENRTYGLVGLDNSRSMLKEARERGATLLGDKNLYPSDYLLEMIKESENEAVIIYGDARDLPLEDNSLDAVISKDVLQYIPDWEKAVEEMYRVVKPGKKVAIIISPFGKRRMMTKVEHKLEELGFSDVTKEIIKIVPYVYATKPDN